MDTTKALAALELIKPLLSFGDIADEEIVEALALAKDALLDVVERERAIDKAKLAPYGLGFTDGPWEVSPANAASGDVVSVMKRDGGELLMVAECFGASSVGNARLISQAPLMAFELVRARQVLNEASMALFKVGGHGDLTTQISVLDSSIKNAINASFDDVVAKQLIK